jgi:predicted NUDIX family NTP pyrophosphohydrolase
MAEFARVVTFEADGAALDALLKEINSAGGPPEGVPATRITVLADRAGGKVVVAVRFASEEDLRKGSEAFEAMSPPDAGSMRRVAVDSYEVVLERTAS